MPASPPHRPVRSALVALGTILFTAGAAAQTHTMGLLLHTPDAFPGYNLYTPLTYSTTYLLDNDGRVVNDWPATGTTHIVYLLDNGNLLRTSQVASSPFDLTAGGGGIIEELDWDGNLVWQYTYATAQVLHHHDVERLPNGNTLLIAWEGKTRQEALDAGRDPAKLQGAGNLWPDHVVEVQPTGPTSGVIVWEWHLWDHLVQDFDAAKDNYGVVADHPELVDLNYTINSRADWNHTNAIAYNPDLDQIALSVHHQSEIWIIDHATTSAEAASHAGGRQGKGGDLLYRWGNPQVYRHGSVAERVYETQHDVQWIPPGLPGAGNLTVFNNGQVRLHSSADEITPPVDVTGAYTYFPGIPYDPPALTWTYEASPATDFYSSIISSAQRLPNGNMFICEGVPGRHFEVRPDGVKVWEYQNPVGNMGPGHQGNPPAFSVGTHRARRYPVDFPGLVGRDLTPQGPIELYALLRNSDVTDLSPVTPALSSIFTGGATVSLNQARDSYLDPFVSGSSETDPLVCDRPLTLYQVWSNNAELKLTKDGPCSIRIVF